ncbi:MAG: DUF4272 domain-containing protein [Polyangiales bacterium]
MKPSASDVATRLLALEACVVYALGAPPREVIAAMRARATVREKEAMEEKAEESRYAYWNPIEATDVFDALTETERALAEADLMTMTLDQQAESVAWLESVGVLAWSLGILEALPPWDRPVDREVLRRIPAPQDLAAFRAKAKLRGTEVIEHGRAVAQLWAERARLFDLETNGFTLPDDLKNQGVQNIADVVKVTTAHAVVEGAIEEAVDGDFPVRDGKYADAEEPLAAELRTIAVERLRAFRWLAGDLVRWDEGDD